MYEINIDNHMLYFDLKVLYINPLKTISSNKGATITTDNKAIIIPVVVEGFCKTSVHIAIRAVFIVPIFLVKLL